MNATLIVSIIISVLATLAGGGHSDAHDSIAKTRVEQAKRDAWFESLKCLSVNNLNRLSYL